MDNREFDDSRLDDPAALALWDDELRRLAGAGARIRVEAGLVPHFDTALRPRGIVAVGSEARLIRAVMEPSSAAPFVAWPLGGLPAWVGALDLVLVLASEGRDESLAQTVDLAVQRGATLMVAAPAGSPVAQRATGSSTLLVPTRTGDPVASAVVLLDVLHDLGIGPEVHTEGAAEAADMVAEQSSPHVDLSSNAAKDLALCLADAVPLVWGGSVLAARAARRIAEALRRLGGCPALAADARDLVPLMTAVGPRDPFADPFDGGQGLGRPMLLMLDDGNPDPASLAEAEHLLAMARRNQVRVRRLVVRSGVTDVDRYVSLLQQGLYGAAYLALGLGMDPSAA